MSVRWRSLLVVALVAVLVRLAVSAAFKGHSYVAAEPVRPEPEAAYLKRGEIGLGDSEQYLLLGASLRQRLSYSWNHEPNTFRTPGYPLLLALLDGNIRLVILAQALLGGMTVLLTGLIGWRWFGARIGLLAGALLALDVPSVFSSGMVMSEVLFTFSVVLATWLLWMRGETGVRVLNWSSLPAGLALGFAVLVRPVALLAFAPLGAILVARRRWAALTVMLAAYLLLPAVWVGRNYLHYGRIGLTSNGGYNLLYANAAAVKGDLERTGWDQARIELARSFTAGLTSDNPLELSEQMTRKATSIILEAPLRYVWVCIRGVPRVIAGIKADDLVLRTISDKVAAVQGSVLLGPGYASSGVRLAVWLLASVEVLTAVGALVLALFSLLQKAGRTEKVLLLALAFYFVAVALPFTDGRFRVPAMPFLYLAAATVLVKAGKARRP